MKIKINFAIKFLALMLYFVTAGIFVPENSGILGIAQVFDEESYYDFAGGDGTAENPYRVKTMYHLNNVRKYLNAYFIQTADIDLTTATAEGGVFYNGGSGWEPIGTSSTAFRGNYDGCGHHIIGLKSKQSFDAGLFGYNCGTIQNLSMERGVMSSKNYAGSIAGRNFNGTITNCYNTGTVTVTSSYNAYAGGIVGCNYNGTITNCYNRGVVTATSSFSSYNAYAGGIVGGNYEGTVTNCNNTGDISTSTLTSFSYSYTGGIVGGNYEGTITNCYNTGVVIATSTFFSDDTYAGGIIGDNYEGTITNCYYHTAPTLNTEYGTELTFDELKRQESYDGFDFETVWYFDSNGYYPFPLLQGMNLPEQEEENYYDFAGGTGRLENPYRISTPQQLDNVRNYLNAYFVQTQNIDITVATADGGEFYNSGSGWMPIGTDESMPFRGNYDGGGYSIIGLKTSGATYAGLFGYNRGIIQNLGIEDSTVLSLTSSLRSYAGGITGYNDDGIITNCYNTGAVTATSTSYYHVYAGGIVGCNYNGTITNCYNSGVVTVESASSLYSSYVGGIVGYSSSTITNCYNTGVVISPFVSSIESPFVGGIVGYSSGAITKSFNLGEITAEGGETTYAGGIAGYSTAKISDVFNSGDIMSQTSSRSDFACGGGLVGYTNGSSISYSYSIGNVQGTPKYTGNVIGYNDGSVFNYLYFIGTNEDSGIGNVANSIYINFNIKSATFYQINMHNICRCFTEDE